jgi:hypothetical protein
MTEPSEVIAQPLPYNLYSARKLAPVTEVVPFCGCLCFDVGILASYPACVGVTQKLDFMCCYTEYAMCKTPQNNDISCMLQNGTTYFAPVSTMAKVRVCGPRNQLLNSE